MSNVPREAFCMKRYFVNKALAVEEPKEKPDREYWKSRITEYAQQIRNFIPPRAEYPGGDLYTGTFGIAYLFYCLVKSPITESQRREYGSKGIEYIWTAEMYMSKRCAKRPTDRYGFLIGDAGFHAVASVLYACIGNRIKSEEYAKRYAEISIFCDPEVYPIPLEEGANELFIGRTGYVLGALWLQKELQTTVVPVDRIHNILQYIVNEGREYSRIKRSPTPLMYAYYKCEYIGAAHGLSSILFALLCFRDFLEQNKDIEVEVKLTTDWILSLQSKNGNFPATTDEIKHLRSDVDHELVHWCHGAPGVVYLMAKAYLYWKEEKYLQSCIKCGELIWEKGLLKKGPGICHGIAGNAYVFLLLYRLTKDEKYIHRATVFADFTQCNEFRANAKNPDNPFSLFEGIAGALCFLLDLLNPNQAAFPFMDVF